MYISELSPFYEPSFICDQVGYRPAQCGWASCNCFLCNLYNTAANSHPFPAIVISHISYTIYHQSHYTMCIQNIYQIHTQHTQGKFFLRQISVWLLKKIQSKFIWCTILTQCIAHFCCTSQPGIALKLCWGSSPWTSPSQIASCYTESHIHSSHYLFLQGNLKELRRQ